MLNNLNESQIEANKPTPPRGHPRWLSFIALIVIGLLFASLSQDRTLIPGWLVVVILVILIGLITLTRLRGHYRMTQRLGLLTATIVTVALILSVALLLTSIPAHRTSAGTLLTDSLLIWITNVMIFALWYWLIDGGGPAHRRNDTHVTEDFLVPQTVAGNKDWVPGFVDYLFLAFNTSTAFSPTDTAVMSRRAKALMMLQASMSLIVLAVLAARAINIF